MSSCVVTLELVCMHNGETYCMGIHIGDLAKTPTEAQRFWLSHTRDVFANKRLSCPPIHLLTLLQWLSFVPQLETLVLIFASSFPSCDV